MSGFLSLFNTPERIEVAEGYWIDVKTSLTAEDHEYAQRALLGKVTMGSSESQFYIVRLPRQYRVHFYEYVHVGPVTEPPIRFRSEGLYDRHSPYWMPEAA